MLKLGKLSPVPLYCSCPSLIATSVLLNVYTPYLPGTENPQPETLKPVLFWLHGGGSTATDPTYDGVSIASRSDVVLVSVNWRQGNFGTSFSTSLPIYSSTHINTQPAYLSTTAMLTATTESPTSLPVCNGFRTTSKPLAETPSASLFSARVLAAKASLTCSARPRRQACSQAQLLRVPHWDRRIRRSRLPMLRVCHLILC